MKQKNLDIRKVIEESGLKYWQVAHALHISEVTFSVRLRKELAERDKRYVYEAIEYLKKEEQ
jgi:predicted XRE-type DNA-binding protein